MGRGGGGPVRIGAVVGLKSEAAVLSRAGLGSDWIRVVAGDGVRARAAGLDLIGAGADLLLSCGVCGGLDPALAPGSVVLADRVVLADGRQIETAAGWVAGAGQCLRAAGVTPVGGAVFGSPAALTTTGDKASARHRLGAIAVDMESHGVAEAAGPHRHPFAVLRVVADPAGRAIPDFALAGMAADGGVRLAPVLAGLAVRPWRLPALLTLAADQNKALAALDAAARAVSTG